MILVTGGTGLVGAHLLFELCGTHTTVKATYRSKKKIALVENVFSYYTNDPQSYLDKITWVKANITDIPSLVPAFQGVKKVYHAAALVSFDPKDDKKLLKTNIEGTANIVNLCIAHSVEKLCFVSSIAAIGPSTNGQPVTEENEWMGNTTTYGTSKHYAEMEVWRASQEGVRTIVVNPGVIIAPGFWRNSSGSFFYHASKGSNYHLPSGTGFVGVNDVTRAMIELMEHSTASGRYILVNQNWPYKKFFGLLAKGLKKPQPKKEIKFWMLRFFWRWDWLRSTILGKRRRFSKVVAGLFTSTAIYDNSKLIDGLGFTYGNLEENIKEYCAIFLQEHET